MIIADSSTAGRYQTSERVFIDRVCLEHSSTPFLAEELGIQAILDILNESA